MFISEHIHRDAYARRPEMEVDLDLMTVFSCNSVPCRASFSGSSGESGEVRRGGRGNDRQQPLLLSPGEPLLGVLTEACAGSESGFEPKRDLGTGWQGRRCHRGFPPQENGNWRPERVHP